MGGNPVYQEVVADAQSKDPALAPGVSLTCGRMSSEVNDDPSGPPHRADSKRKFGVWRVLVCTYFGGDMTAQPKPNLASDFSFGARFTKNFNRRGLKRSNTIASGFDAHARLIDISPILRRLCLHLEHPKIARKRKQSVEALG